MNDDAPHEPVRPADDAEPEQQRRRRLRRRQEIEDAEREERVTARIAHHWAQLRDERRGEPAPAVIVSGPSNFSRAQVPWGVDLAAAWAWRFLVIVVAGYFIVMAIDRLREVTVPLAIALLIAALVSPLVRALGRIGVPRGPASLLTVLLTLGVIAGLLTLAGQQIAAGADDLASSTADGLGQIRDWLKTGPLHASDSQINDYIESAQKEITAQVQQGDIAGRVTEVGSTISQIFTGLFIVLFATYFFLADGDRIWAFLVRLSPRAARARVDSSGRVAWTSLTQFVRATVIVAATDAAGVMIGAAVLGVPFVFPIGVVVFLGAFVPLVGAFVAGGVAVLVALVAEGPVVALLMLGVIVLVQQLESHILQPFLMGRWVAVHPLAVIIAIATGIVLAGITGALIAVPLTAVVNAVVTHLASYTGPGADPVHELAEDYGEQESTEPVEDRSDVDAVMKADHQTAQAEVEDDVQR
ncbi:AI-2E family transporter [Nocardioides plantarum]|uniref:AI-2E family transporter n=1 Tax=Nocardioides plantarum TaxID=29299 RepID=A0ABV5KA32_9ACTN|nr:AI-2E family transporter [Nocardioides plantarum]